MKNLCTVLLTAMLFACSGEDKKAEQSSSKSAHAEHAEDSSSKPKSKSPKTTKMANVGDNHIHIEYHAPSKRGRQIFGGLVAYDEVWVTGAHSATFIQFSEDVEIEGTEIVAGKYALFTIPGENVWTIIINKNWDQHLADEYDASEDLIRVTVVPQQLEEPVETLNYQIEAKNNDLARISISWDDILISVDVRNT